MIGILMIGFMLPSGFRIQELLIGVCLKEHFYSRSLDSENNPQKDYLELYTYIYRAEAQFWFTYNN